MSAESTLMRRRFQDKAGTGHNTFLIASVSGFIPVNLKKQYTA
jgi:hypothetical protein